jgi:5-formyltetrahydrofolate cyclo-ligase
MAENLIKERKQALRAAAISQRTCLKRKDSQTWSRLIQEKVLQFPPYVSAQAIALYSPIQNEVDTEAIRDQALSAGKAVHYPKLTRESSLELVQIDADGAFSVGRFGILEPAGDRRLLQDDPSQLIIMVPGVVFDSRGNRLGRGLGYYDRFLQQLRANTTFVGLAYEFQIVDEVPAELWDQRVHYVITERRIIDCTTAQSSLEV